MAHDEKSVVRVRPSGHLRSADDPRLGRRDLRQQRKGGRNSEGLEE